MAAVHIAGVFCYPWLVVEPIYTNSKMKVVLAGVTGFIGREILDQCLQNPSITSIVALSRRELQPPVTGNSKVKVVLMNDFLVYPKPVLEELSGAEACIWSVS